MADLQLLDCFQPELVRLERVHYFPRQLLTADDMVADQDYFRQKLRRHNRFLHGWGVVCGLDVTAAPVEGFPWRVKIDAGYALGPYGDEIDVAKPVFLDLAKCGPGAATNPCEPSLLLTNVAATGGPVFLAIKYTECVAKPVRAMPAGCACEEEACEYSRIRDSFQIECLTELPPLPPTTLLCELRDEKKLPLCPSCPTEPWVVLARVTLPASPSTPVPGSSIDNFVRRQLYSSTLLQEQLIACCCEERPQPSVIADMRITQTATPSLFAPGSLSRLIRYTLTVANAGPSPAQNVFVTNTPPSVAGITLTISDFSNNWTQTPTSGPFTAQLGTLQPGENVVLEFTLRFTLPMGVPSVTLSNSAEVTSTTLDENLDNNSSTSEITV